MPSRSEVLTIERSLPSERLDTYLRGRFPAVSRGTIQRLIEEGHIRVNGQTVKPTHAPRRGETVEVHWPEARPAVAKPEEMPLDILYEDEALLVLNKPPGLVVHPAPGHSAGTLVNALLHHCPDLGGIGAELRPGIVHRLDKDTSGTLVVAKNAAAVEHLSGQFKQRTVKKDYLALVYGEMPAAAGVIRLPIGRHPLDRKRMSTRSRKGREAETEWRAARRWHGCTLLELRLKTGRTHQIRVHCAAIGRPIVGDPTYGRRKAAGDSPESQALFGAIRRQMLHAWRLEIVHPRSGEPMRFESPLPEDMKRLIAELNGSRSKMEAGN